MKTFLKFALVFVLGLAIGGGVVGYLVRENYQDIIALTYVLELGEAAAYARLLKDGDEKYLRHYIDSMEQRIPGLVLTIQNEEKLRNKAAEIGVMNTAKEFYVCTNTPFPAEIADIMNNLPPVSKSYCIPNPDFEESAPAETGGDKKPEQMR